MAKSKIKATIQPTLNRLEVRMMEQNNITASGLQLAANPVQYGMVLSVGPGAYNTQGQPVPMQAKEGDIVVFRHWVTEVRASDNMMNLILTEDQVLGILNV